MVVNMDKYINMGLKLTPQRIAILKYLEGNRNHPSAEDVYREVKNEFQTTTFATVYNTLNTLKDKGEIKELFLDPDRKRFDPDTSPHHHIICIKCKEISEVWKDFSIELKENETNGYEVIDARVDIIGLCPKCKKSRLKRIDNRKR